VKWAVSDEVDHDSRQLLMESVRKLWKQLEPMEGTKSSYPTDAELTSHPMQLEKLFVGRSGTEQTPVHTVWNYSPLSRWDTESIQLLINLGGDGQDEVGHLEDSGLPDGLHDLAPSRPFCPPRGLLPDF